MKSFITLAALCGSASCSMLSFETAGVGDCTMSTVEVDGESLLESSCDIRLSNKAAGAGIEALTARVDAIELRLDTIENTAAPSPAPTPAPTTGLQLLGQGTCTHADTSSFIVHDPGSLTWTKRGVGSANPWTSGAALVLDTLSCPVGPNSNHQASSQCWLRGPQCGIEQFQVDGSINAESTVNSGYTGVQLE
jgi:hypothetical protein